MGYLDRAKRSRQELGTGVDSSAEQPEPLNRGQSAVLDAPRVVTPPEHIVSLYSDYRCGRYAGRCLELPNGRVIPDLEVHLRPLFSGRTTAQTRLELETIAVALGLRGALN